MDNLYIYIVIGVAALYVASATIKFKKVPKYKHSYFIPLYVLLWFDLLFSIFASFNFPWMSTMVGFWTALIPVFINLVVVIYAFLKHKSVEIKSGKSNNKP